MIQSAGIIFVFMNLMFVIAQFKKDNSIVDIGWGLGFLLVALAALLQVSSITIVHLVFSIMVALWSLRLAAYIWIRNRGTGEDYRYAAWRREWGKNVVWRAYLQVFLLQGFIMWIVLSPSYVVFADLERTQGMTHYVGIVLWFIGFFFEVVGDAQMMHFKADPSNKGKVMKQGLWNYTRHPNYFGEALLWWGLGVYSFAPQLWWMSFLGPALITFLLLKVSGVAMLERKYDGNPKYAEYKGTTSAFIPWPPKKTDTDTRSHGIL